MTTTESRAEPLTADPTAWLRAEVAELRADLFRMRAEIETEVRTRRIVVMAGDLSTTIEPGCVTVEKWALDGSRVAMRAASDGGEVIVAGHTGPDEDPRVCARLYAGDQGCDDGLTAFVSLESHRVAGRGDDRSEILAVEASTS